MARVGQTNRQKHSETGRPDAGMQAKRREGKQTDGYRQTGRQADSEPGKQAGEQGSSRKGTEGQTGRHADLRAGMQAGTPAGRQAGSQTDRQEDKPTGNQSVTKSNTNRQIDG